ncbi:MAG: hypothetical protein KDC48_08550, partial [Planctomycetes bacterium]|nr:hypothetical protein [Planctomycetota bacterium]
MTTVHRAAKFVLLTCAMLGAAGQTCLQAQGGGTQQGVDQDVIDKLRRDQDEILRKAERMRALMERLQQRYEREGKKEQVELLRQGLAHLDKTSILRDVASIRDDLAATALTEALRKQQQVVEELESLLNILLERKSVENLDAAMQLAAEQAATAAALAARQAELQQRTNEALRGEPTATERQLLDDMRELADKERNEAERNARESGSRRPFLENALQRVQQLLRQQDRLERGLADQTDGGADANRQRQFDLGEIVQRARELTGQLRDEQRQHEVGDAARQLQGAAEGNDNQATQDAR